MWSPELTDFTDELGLPTKHPDTLNDGESDIVEINVP
jgi:hypothetical protein